ITEFGTSASTDVYGSFFVGNSSTNLWLASGGGCTSAAKCWTPGGGPASGVATDASRAIGILNNGAAYRHGIEFAHNALAGNDGKTLGQQAAAIVMPEGDRIDWQYCTNQSNYPAGCGFGALGATIYSQVTNNASAS